MQLLTLVPIAFVIATAGAEATIPGMTAAKLEPRHNPLLFARQSDDCVSQYGQGWQACNGSGLCYNAAAGAVCCTDNEQNYVCPNPGATCAGNGLCNNPTSSSNSNAATRPMAGMSFGLIGVAVGMAVAL